MRSGVPSEVIDAHTHAFPGEWVADRSHHLDRDHWFGELYAAPTARMVDAGDLLAAMDDAGIARAVMCGWPWADAGHCREHNDYLAEAAAASGGRLSWLATISPVVPGAAEEAERALSQGASGVGEMNADAQGFDLTRPDSLHDVAAVLVGAGLPVMLHASEPVGHPYPGKGMSTPDRLLTFLGNHPGLSVVLAHWGGGLPFYELMPEVTELTRNVVYDTAASTYLYRPRVFRTVLDIVGPERVLWGSDHPVLGMGRFLRRTLRDAEVRDDEVARIFTENARRVYRLPDTLPVTSA